MPREACALIQAYRHTPSPSARAMEEFYELFQLKRTRESWEVTGGIHLPTLAAMGRQACRICDGCPLADLHRERLGQLAAWWPRVSPDSQCQCDKCCPDEWDR